MLEELCCSPRLSSLALYTSVSDKTYAGILFRGTRSFESKIVVLVLSTSRDKRATRSF